MLFSAPRTGEEAIPMADLGNKHDCFKCHAKFYDLRRSEVVCPKCGSNQKEAKKANGSPVTPSRSSRRSAHAPAPAPPPPPPAPDAELGELDDPVAAVDDEDDEEALVFRPVGDDEEEDDEDDEDDDDDE